MNDGLDVIIHMGAPKTGSSAIQKFCCENADKLLKLGIYYPKHTLDVNGISGGHSFLAGPLLKGDSQQAVDAFQAALENARKHGATLILSSEGFYRQPETMRELTKDLSVKVVGFFRDPLDALISNYNQAIKRHFSTVKLSDFCHRLIHSANDYLSGTYLHRWADTFGDAHCSFRPYEKARYKKAPIEYQFLEILGIMRRQCGALTYRGEQINRSYTDSALELKRLLNHVLDDDTQDINNEIDWFLQGYSDRSDERSLTLAEQLDERTIGELCDAFEPSNHQLRERFGWLDSDFGDYTALRQAACFTSLAQSGVVTPGLPLQALCAQHPVVEERLRPLVTARVKGANAPFALLKLADLLNITFAEPTSSPRMMPKKRLETLLSERCQPADFLRELALMMEAIGDVKAAKRLIDRSQALRPKGQIIIKIQSRINKQCGNG